MIKMIFIYVLLCIVGGILMTLIGEYFHFHFVTVLFASLGFGWFIGDMFHKFYNGK
jgi:hypothetical protein